MYEVKSKKSGALTIVSDEDYDSLVNDGNIDMNRFEVTHLQMKSIIPSLPKEIKITKKTKA
jgi:hypothetical protein